MANIGYIRVSTVNEDQQLAGLKRYGIDKLFVDKVSGKNSDRPALQALIDCVREGDTVFIHDFSVIARNTKDLLEKVECLEKKGVSLVSNKENLDTRTPTGRHLLTMIAAIAEFERTNLLERQREGIAVAKSKGVYKGRRPITIDKEQFEEQYKKYKCRELSKTTWAKNLNVSRPTLDKLIKAYTEKKSEN